MNVTGKAWRVLTEGEKMCVLQYAADEKAKRRERRRTNMQNRIKLLDKFLSLTVTHPKWFENPVAAQEWIEKELAEMKDSRPARPLSIEKQNNILIPSIAAWGSVDKGGVIH